MERIVPKRNKSVKFSPGTSEDGSEDEAGKHASRIRKPARPQRPGHLSIQHGLSNAHLVLRRYAALDGFGTSEVPDDEHEILNSPKVAPAQPIDRCSLNCLIQSCLPTPTQAAAQFFHHANNLAFMTHKLSMSKGSHAHIVHHVSLHISLWCLPLSHTRGIVTTKFGITSHCTHNCSVASFQHSSLSTARQSTIDMQQSTARRHV